MKNMKKIFISMLVIATLGVIGTSINIYADDVNFVGYSVDQNRKEFGEELLKDETNTIKFNEYSYEKNLFNYQSTNQVVSDSAPLLTILIPGLKGKNSTWSNDSQFLTDDRDVLFSYDSQSIIERLRTLTNGNVYHADMTSPRSFKLSELSNLRQEEVNIKRIFEENGSITKTELEPIKYELDKAKGITELTDISKHFIVVFNPHYINHQSGTNDFIYNQLDYLIDKLVYDIKCLNNGLLPKINLIGHSRGGITSM